MRIRRLACLAAVAAACGGNARTDVAARRPAAPAAAPEGPAIDRLVEAAWRDAGVTPAPDAGDAEYLRRVTLDIAGRIPTPGEVTAFLADESPAKREALVDRLLASDDYAEHFADVYLDLLVGRDARVRPRLSRTLRRYLTDAFAANTPFDQMTRELLGADGSAEDTPAIGYMLGNLLRGGNTDLIAGKTARVFLGLQIQCAQCHDHPFDPRYSQRDYAGFAAFFAGAQVQRARDEDGEIVRPPRFSVFDNFNGAYRIGDEAIAPRFLGRTVVPEAGETRRDSGARAIVESPLFAKVTVNRTWRELTGVALSEPWDDLGAADDPKHSPLLDAAAAELRASGYDHKALVKSIALSKAYGRSSRGGAGPDGDPSLPERVHARALVRPLSPDQLFRSLFVATGLDKLEREGALGGAIERRKNQALREYLFVFGDETMGDVDTFTGSIPQALLLLNSELTNGGARAEPQLALGRIGRATDDRAQRIEWMYMAAFARAPTPAELARHSDYLAGRDDAAEAYEDLFYAMLTSTEFATNH